MQYTETVEPTSIARRLMEIREQVAEQLSADLLQMTAENARLQEDYQYEVSAAAIDSRRWCMKSVQPLEMWIYQRTAPSSSVSFAMRR